MKEHRMFFAALGATAAACLTSACNSPGSIAPAPTPQLPVVVSETTQDFVPPPSPVVTSTADPYELLRERLAAADVAITAWDKAERKRMGSPAVDDGSLELLPIDSFSPITPWYSDSRIHEYGRKSANFDARRAAVFASLMRPDVPAFHAGDLSDADGSTPSGALGLRHPSGAHVYGYSVDLSYAGMPEGQHTLDQLDVEAAAWQFYSILESKDVVSILTAYKDSLVQLAGDWYVHDVIGFEALTRFRDDVWLDTTLNHDGHLHINTSDSAGLLLTPSESAYKCYVATTGSWGTEWVKTCD